MATKTISLRLDAYEKLRQARRSPSESFTDVVLRATWPEKSVTGAELLEIYRKAALAHEKALVTSNVDHFQRVPDLEVVTYRS